MLDVTIHHAGYDDVPSRSLAGPTAAGRRGHLIVIANRQPFRHERQPAGDIIVRRSTSGVVAASESLVRHSHGIWIAQAETSEDWLDGGSHEPVPPRDPDYLLRRVWLDADEREGFYERFSNEGLWPMCHDVPVQPEFRSPDFDTYWSVNAKFVDAAIEESLSIPSVVFVQDYHFALAPLMLRQELPESSIVSFWHIPWPSLQRLEVCPWATYLIEGLLGSHVLGFQTQQHGANFMDAAEHLLGADVERHRGVVTYLGRRTHVRVYPASIELDPPALRLALSPDECAAAVRREHGLPASCRIIGGVDRIDYTKGLEEKLLALERMLERYPDRVGNATLVQIAQPSRERITAYRQLRSRLDALADRINRRFARGGWRPVVLVEQEQDAEHVYRLLRAANVCYVGSLDDGMNLVAKEFVNARDDEQGVLVLSAKAGAVHELSHAVAIDPRNIDTCAQLLEEALRMAPDEQRYRMRKMRTRVRAWDAEAWGTRILGDVVRLCSLPVLDEHRMAFTAANAT
jgi:trehalose 6-phosphate synthase